MSANATAREICDETEDGGGDIHISNPYLRYSEPVRQPMLSILHSEYHGHEQIACEGSGGM